MALVKSLKGQTPHFGENIFLAETATVIGDFTCGDDCSIWYNAVVRADVNFIKLGNKVNIQDNAMIHCTYQKCGTIIGNNVSIGHNAIVHGCTVNDNVLIGMGSIIMDNAVIGSNSIIAAGAIVTEGTIVEEYSVYAGIPAKKIKQLSPELFEGEVMRIVNNYVKYASWYK